MANQSIGADEILEILSRANSLHTVGRCRLLSNECNSLTYESIFTRLNCERTRIVRGFFIQTCTINKYFSEFVSTENPDTKFSLEFLPAPVKILACANQGLLLCVSTSSKHRRIPQFYVCKPATKEWRKIPNPKTRHFTRAIAMMVLGSNSLHYKIMRLSEPKKSRNLNYQLYYYYILRCEIFDSETWAWKQLDEIYLPRQDVLSFSPAISVCGVFHWLTSQNNIFAFNVNDETWTMFSPPEPLNRTDLHLQLSEYKGKLALFNMAMEGNKPTDLWVMEHYSKRIWDKIDSIITKPVLGEGGYDFHLEAFHNADILLMTDYCKVVFYNFRNFSFDVVRLDKFIDPHGIFHFQSDLEPTILSFKPLQQRGKALMEKNI